MTCNSWKAEKWLDLLKKGDSERISVKIGCENKSKEGMWFSGVDEGCFRGYIVI